MAFHFSIFGVILRERRETMMLPDCFPSGEKSGNLLRSHDPTSFRWRDCQKHTNNFGDSHHNLAFAASET
jgi:hypothetical protein